LENHEKYINRCFELAQRGLGKTSPNPLVGSVIVYEDRIIGEGFHKQYGSAHAEVNAIANVKPAHASLLPQSTIYVNMEPCDFHGNTPACSKLLIEKKFKRVVVSNIDPHPKVSGKGIERLKSAGIEVIKGVLEKKGRWLNRRFYTFMEKKRPYIILKWAQSNDGYIGRNDGVQINISNSFSKKIVHKWRSQEDGILIGVQTAINDNPKLTVREWNGPQPLRILFDPSKRAPKDLNIFDDTADSLVISKESLDIVADVKQKNESSFIELFINKLPDFTKVKIQSILIEGGSKTLQNFIDSGYWDEARIITSSKILKSGVSAPSLEGKTLTVKDLSGDQLTIFKNGECNI